MMHVAVHPDHWSQEVGTGAPQQGEGRLLLLLQETGEGQRPRKGPRGQQRSGTG